MTVIINISPAHEELLRRAFGPDLDRGALEAMVIEGYRTGKLSASEVGRVLGHTDRGITNRWLADRKVPLGYSTSDLDSDRAAMDRLLGKSN